MDLTDLIGTEVIDGSSGNTIGHLCGFRYMNGKLYFSILDNEDSFIEDPDDPEKEDIPEDEDSGDTQVIGEDVINEDNVIDLIAARGCMRD